MSRSPVAVIRPSLPQGRYAHPFPQFGAAFLLLSLLACGGGGGGGNSASTPAATPPPAAAYLVTNLVSDQAAAAAATTDTNLVNPWGLAYGPTTDFWVANQATSTTTVYDGLGQRPATPIVVTIPPMAGHVMVGPTGVVFNGSTNFLGDEFMVASLDGCICGWSAGTSMTRRVDNSSSAIYTGLATGTNGTASYLFAANLNSGAVDVFDSTFAPVSLGASAFMDPTLPTGFSPYNVQVLGGKLYVSYAKHDSGALRETPGPGLGYISLFNLDGTFVRRVASAGALNAPWGMALAPASFGTYAGALLVGNFGDGHITALDATTGASLGQLANASGTALAINGLWGLAFGNDAAAGKSNQLYITAGPQAETHGLFATISFGTASTGGGTGGTGGTGY